MKLVQGFDHLLLCVLHFAHKIVTDKQVLLIDLILHVKVPVLLLGLLRIANHLIFAFGDLHLIRL